MSTLRSRVIVGVRVSGKQGDSFTTVLVPHTHANGDVREGAGGG